MIEELLVCNTRIKKNQTWQRQIRLKGLLRKYIDRYRQEFNSEAAGSLSGSVTGKLLLSSVACGILQSINSISVVN